MLEKEDIPIDLLDKDRSTPLIKAWFEIVHLKQHYRQGWLKRGVPPAACETVAEHTFGNAMLCLLLLQQYPELDAHRVLRMALIHDLGEVYVGDITPHDNVAKVDKNAMEAAAVHKILERFPNGEALIADWLEYESQASPEARFVKQIDRLELALQASVYEHQGKVDAAEFFTAAASSITDEKLRHEVEVLKALSAGHSPSP